MTATIDDDRISAKPVVVRAAVRVGVTGGGV
jgi:hypothetical protein